MRNTDRNFHPAVILRDQPTFYDKRFAIYEFGPIFGNLNKFRQKWYFWGSNWYILYERRIETLGLQSFRGVNQASTTIGSGDIELSQFWHFLAQIGKI